jgi:hypothetical protein
MFWSSERDVRLEHGERGHLPAHVRVDRVLAGDGLLVRPVLVGLRLSPALLELPDLLLEGVSVPPPGLPVGLALRVGLGLGRRRRLQPLEQRTRARLRSRSVLPGRERQLKRERRDCSMFEAMPAEASQEATEGQSLYFLIALLPYCIKTFVLF